MMLGIGISLTALAAFFLVRAHRLNREWRQAYGVAVLYTNDLLKGLPQPALPAARSPVVNEFFRTLTHLGEEFRKKADSVLELEKLRGDFVSNVSHELRTPLTSIKGYTETLKAGALKDAQAAEKFIHRIDENADRLKTLIDDILALSKIEAFPRDLDWEEFPAERMSEKVTAIFEPLIRQRRQSLIIEFKPLKLEGDFAKLEQVFSNLVHNAIKYSNEGSAIRVFGELVDGQFVFKVKDNGPGIEPVHQARIFERFYRVDAARSRDSGGSGLGLAICKHIVGAHGGSIDVRSLHGQGTEFSFIIPKRRVKTALNLD